MDHPRQTDDPNPWEPRYDSDAPALEYRYDRGELLAPVKLANGTLITEGFAAKEGVLEYRRADGTVRRELVPFECLESSLDSLSDLPLTLHHPDPRKYPDGVTPKNVDELGVGNTGEVVKLLNGGHTKVHIAIRRQDAIDAVEKEGVRELSLGYAVQLDHTPGVHPVHGPYDARQVRRVHNHLALVPRGRFGAEVGIRADGAYSTQTITGASTTGGTPASSSTTVGRTAPGGAVKPIIVQLVAAYGLTGRYDSDDAALEAIGAEVKRRQDAERQAEQQRNDAASKAATDHKAALDKLTGERDAEKTRADKAEGELAALKAEERKRADAAERTDLEKLAAHFQVDPKPHQDSKGLKRAIASAYQGEEIKADASDDYVAGLLKGARREFERNGATARDDGFGFDPADGSGRSDGASAWDSQEPPPQPRQDGARGQGAPKPPLGTRLGNLYRNAGQQAADGGK